MSRALATGEVKAKTQDIIAGLHATHPDAQPGEILNYLITAYCPMAASSPGLSEDQRRTKLDEYVLMARGLLY